jgi:microcin C transport system ATP-binding protein
MAMLFITHDLGIVRKFADRVCVMTDGKIVETGVGRRDLRQSAAPYTQACCSPPNPRASRPSEPDKRGRW